MPSQSTDPARFYPRLEAQRSTESAPSYPASNAAPKGSQECDPSPSSSRSDPHRGSPSPSECPLRLKRSSTTAAPQATPHNYASTSNQQQQDSFGSDAQALSERPSSPHPASPLSRSSPSTQRCPSACRPHRPVPSESPSTARADNSPAAKTAPNPEPQSGSCCAAAVPPVP